MFSLIQLCWCSAASISRKVALLAGPIIEGQSISAQTFFRLQLAEVQFKIAVYTSLPTKLTNGYLTNLQISIEVRDELELELELAASSH